ncbi:MAG TPA: ATP-binding protein, partial [Steroidobacteraceae bacterium]
MADDDAEDAELRSVALKNAESILSARRRAEEALLVTKEALEKKTQELEEQREWFQVSLSSIGDAVITTDVNGAITFLNPVAERMTGSSSRAAAGQPLEQVFRIINELTRAPVINPIRLVLRDGNTVGLANHTALVSNDGTETPIDDTAAPIRDAHGRLIGAVMVFHDVTVRRRVELALRQESETLELLNETGTAIAAQLNLQTLLPSVTDAATKLSAAEFGAFCDNVIVRRADANSLHTRSRAAREAFEQLGLPRNTPIFNPTFRGERVVRLADITRDPDYASSAANAGAPTLIRSYLAVPVISRSSEVIGGLFFGHSQPNMFSARTERLILGVAAQAAVAIDNARLYEGAQAQIARREQAEAALRETDRRKDEFLATLAHELRNPLAPIRQAALISKMPSATEAQKRWSHDVISRQVQHMSLLLDDLLDVSRITRGTLQLRKQATELASVIDAAVETARPTLDAKRHHFTVDLCPEQTYFSADPMRIAQILSNLLTNAAKYTDPEGTIRLVARRSTDSVTIQVIDNGIGIADEALPRIFQMFSQVAATHDRSDGGLGIGLALAKGLIELHGGRIEAKSAGLGQGSEFTVSLPIGALGMPLGSGDPIRTGPRAAPKRRVLIADDNRDSAESLAMLLRMEGHEVMVVHDGPAALQAVVGFDPQFALLDIGMPGMSGYEVARKLRESLPASPLRLVAVTGWGQHSDKARARSSGFDHHFTKPVEPERLMQLL